jgi:hypothetical protein
VLLFILHFVLYSATYQKRPLTKILILILLVFFVSRVGIMQLDLDYFVYQNFFPTVLQMREILFVLLLVSVSLLAGCFVGERLFKKSEHYGVLWASSIKDEDLYYSYLIIIYIFFNLISIYLFLGYGYTVSLDHRLYDKTLMIIGKVSRTLNFLSILAIYWLIIRKPRGFKRKITIFAVLLFILSNIITGSKVALIYSILPFILVYYVAGIPIPLARAKLFMWVLVLSIIVIYPLMASLRPYLRAILLSIPVSFSDTFGGLNILSIFFKIFSRVGSSFDVLSFIVPNKDIFVPYANLTAEFINIINGYYPGEIFAVNAPEWAGILYGLGNNVPLSTMIKIGTGENIGLIPHIFINFGIIGVCFWSFFITLMYGMVYNKFNIFIRVIITIWIIFQISNGSGFVSMIISIPILLFYLMVLRVSYRIIRPIIRQLSSKSNSKTMQINSSQQPNQLLT